MKNDLRQSVRVHGCTDTVFPRIKPMGRMRTPQNANVPVGKSSLSAGIPATSRSPRSSMPRHTQRTGNHNIQPFPGTIRLIAHAKAYTAWSGRPNRQTPDPDPFASSDTRVGPRTPKTVTPGEPSLATVHRAHTHSVRVNRHSAGCWRKRCSATIRHVQRQTGHPCR